MIENEENSILFTKNMYKTMANFMVIWFITIMCFYLLASLSSFTFVFTMSGLDGFGPSLLVLYYLEGLIIGLLIFILKNYSVMLQIDESKRGARFMLNSNLVFLSVLALLGLYIIIIGIARNLSVYQSLPITVIANQGVADIFIDFMISAAILVLILGILMLVKNTASTTTKFFFLSFLLIGFACFIYAIYVSTFPLFVYDFSTDPVSVTEVANPQATQLFFLFFILIQLGFYILIHAIRSISYPGQFWLPKKFYFLFFVLLILSTLLLFSGEIKHVVLDNSYIGELVRTEQTGPYTFTMYTEGGYIGMHNRVREFSIVFSIIYSLIQFIPICISLYYLSKFPPWITPARRSWLNRIKLGITVYSFFPICETIAGIRIPLTTGYISAYNPLERYKLILALAFLIIFLSILIIFSGVPKVDRWFFDEVKMRATPEIVEINPDINLAAIWETVDNLQKSKPLSPAKMTENSLSEYVLKVKQLLLEGTFEPAVT